MHSLFLECNSVCTDTRKIKKDDIFFALKGDNFNGNVYAEQALKKGGRFPSLTAQAQKVAHFYIDVAEYNLWQSSPPSGPHAHRLCSRWRRRTI